ncbi:probable ascorbate-specific transmembrane electron transporter 1 isoform X3 [Olea europaea var. sylvestris]|uniref:ascorbate ferrireductase (transmembrane) n=1 Tax=Olea europaea subsp. europaea TaxID=158383 RepID=A0A8S0VM27_OLEEU|nr:probable ascorbate-specific transmembrane electron transporter 1 isoform X1 [Olea europaea var. sylvestris]XP_022882185.1 probable ascorbate-specific transmembrane electron transporter 1 isoform X2 [Olea europaea var. sylvestris]XP_022882186.1 probable ascorbate-specific transmembrane electron transporter 1 isoform X3 [Olea europaea var. sylvestris]CAA3031216.1 probable ascorbate-specific transmembrane electron transporter 1 [Olea europaea subsp. europaea]
MAPKRSYNYGMSSFPVSMFAHLLAIAITTLVLVWLLHFREGLAFKSANKPKIFNVHPLLMVIGFVLISGQAIMAYKTVRARRNIQKIFHLILHFIALAAGIVGIYAVFKYHHESGLPDVYTLHSWLGISTISLFGLQWIFSFISLWFPGAKPSARDRLIPWHALFGAVIFFMAILSAETGLVERFIFLSLRRSQEALIVNFTGLLILLFAISVGFTLLL